MTINRLFNTQQRRDSFPGDTAEVQTGLWMWIEKKSSRQDKGIRCIWGCSSKPCSAVLHSILHSVLRGPLGQASWGSPWSPLLLGQSPHSSEVPSKWWLRPQDDSPGVHISWIWPASQLP